MSKEDLQFIRFPLGNPYTGSNAYLVINEPTKEAVIFDAGFDDDNLLNYLKENNINLKKIILTHGHYDHIGGVQKLKEETGAEIIISESDEDYLKRPELNLSNFSPEQIIIDKADVIVKNGDKIEIAPGVEVEVMETPGHTPGSICFIGDGFVVVGDVLFQGSIGRTDFDGGNYSDMMESLSKLIKLPDDTLVLPGHGEVTTIGAEKATNPFLRNLI